MDEFNNFGTLEKYMINRARSRKVPINGSIELLPLCNMNCKMCYIRLDYEEMCKQGELHTVDEWISVCKEMAKSGVLFMLLSGGEPLLYPDFKKLYLALRNLGMVITINTNGTLIDEEWAFFFGKYKPRRINITLYGSSENTYERLCQYKEGYQKTLNGIKLLLKQGVAVKINGSMTKENWEEIDEIYEIGKKLNVPVSVDTYMLPSLKERTLPLWQQSRLEPEKAAYIEWKVLQHDYTQEQLHNYVSNIVSKVELRNTIFPDCITCMAGNCSFSINWKGELRPCLTFEEQFDSVFEVGFEKAWNTVLEKSKHVKLNKECTICKFRVLCRNCVACAHVESGNYDGVPQYICRYTKTLYKIMKEYIEKNKL